MIGKQVQGARHFPLWSSSIVLALGIAWGCGGEAQIEYSEAPPGESSSEEGEQATGGNDSDADSSASGVQEGVGEIPLDSSTDAEDSGETDAAEDSLALAALSDEDTAGAFCRWQSVVEQQQQAAQSSSNEMTVEPSIEECNARAAACQQRTIGSDDQQARLPEMMKTVSDDLLALEDCDLPVMAVDSCVAELVVVLEPYADTMSCGQEPQPFPMLASRATELPSCLLLVVMCTSVLDSVQESLAGSN